MAASRAVCECAREASRNSWDTFGCVDVFMTFVRVGVVGPRSGGCGGRNVDSVFSP